MGFAGVEAFSGCQGRPAEKARAKSAGITVYVSPSGNDRWSGTWARAAWDGSDGPVASVERALEIVRDWRKVTRAVSPYRTEIILRGGTYEITKAIALAPEDSGTSESPLVISGYPGEHVIISGDMWVVVNYDPSASNKRIPESLIFDRNIVVVDGDNVWPPASPATIAAGCKFSHNVYWSARGVVPTIHGDKFKQWRATGQDAGSLAAPLVSK